MGTNLAVDPAIDCPLKTFAASFAAYLQPQQRPNVGNWTIETVEAMRLAAICKLTVADIPPPPFIRSPTVPPQRPSNCQFLAYVDAVSGDDSNPGTLEQPWKDVQTAVARSRGRPPETSACIYLRRGSYFWGGHKERYGSQFESQVGGLSLNAVDSGLTLSAYEGEEVIFSAGVSLTSLLQWSLYKTTPAGPIMQAKVPAGVDVAWEHFNELYMDDGAAVRAKFPNGDPFKTGRHTNPTGYVNGAAKWFGPDRSIPPALEIHVGQPTPNSTFFPDFQVSQLLPRFTANEGCAGGEWRLRGGRAVEVDG